MWNLNSTSLLLPWPSYEIHRIMLNMIHAKLSFIKDNGILFTLNDLYLLKCILEICHATLSMRTMCKDAYNIYFIKIKYINVRRYSSKILESFK